MASRSTGGSTRIAGESHVFHGTTAANRAPDARCLRATTAVAAGDRLYFHLRRGAWQDADFSYYSFTVSYDAAADLTPPVSTHTLAGGTLTLAATDDRSGVATLEYLPDTKGAEWTRYTGPVAMPAGDHVYLYGRWTTRATSRPTTGSPRPAAKTPAPAAAPAAGRPADDQGTGPPGPASGLRARERHVLARPGARLLLHRAERQVGRPGTHPDQRARRGPGRQRDDHPTRPPAGSRAAASVDPDREHRALSGHPEWTLDLPAFELSVEGGAEIKGFEIEGNAAFSIVEGGVKVDVEVGLPTIPGLPGGLTAGATLRATNAEGLKLDGLKVELGELPIRGLVLKGASLSYVAHRRGQGPLERRGHRRPADRQRGRG